MKMKGVLGLNSRNHLYTSQYNPRKNKRIANSKLETKKTLTKAEIRVPRSYAVIRNSEELEKYDFLSLPEDFVIKPDNGLGGQGIIVVEKQGLYAGEWVTAQGEVVTTEDLKLHVADILAGQYAMDDLPDVAYIEERVRVHPVFSKYSYHGTPDIRVIVFNGVPIMSYVRFPTEESGGRANLFQGAAAVGIDIATGVTTYGVHHAKQAEFLPSSRRKLRGIEIPQWDQILETAIGAAKAIGLGYMASDIVLQPALENGKKEELAVPMILEVNAQPGLKIQIANKAGLRERLERVKGLKIRDAKHGIRVAKALFADAKLMEKGFGRKTVTAFEEVEITGANGEKISVRAKIDTGADSSSIDRDLAKELGLLEQENFLYDEFFRNALGRKKREVVGVKFMMAGRRIKTRVSVADRSRLRSKFLVGRRDLKNFVVMVE
ncbi:MAG: sugar-transfer associated ATP-grasp domain-containing protein [bacterium]